MTEYWVSGIEIDTVNGGYDLGVIDGPFKLPFSLDLTYVEMTGVGKISVRGPYAIFMQDGEYVVPVAYSTGGTITESSLPPLSFRTNAKYLLSDMRDPEYHKRKREEAEAERKVWEAEYQARQALRTERDDVMDILDKLSEFDKEAVLRYYESNS